MNAPHAPSADVLSDVYAAAVLAIADHIHTLHLPAPREISRNFHPSRAMVLEVRLDMHHHDAWLDTVTVDENLGVRPNEYSPNLGSASWSVRLPNGTWFILSAPVRMQAPSLLLVEGGGAR